MAVYTCWLVFLATCMQGIAVTRHKERLTLWDVADYQAVCVCTVTCISRLYIRCLHAPYIHVHTCFREGEISAIFD